MIGIYNGLRSMSRLSGVIARSYHNTIVSAPPKVKISTGEKILSLLCIGGAILISPMYFVPNFKNYAQKKSD